MKLALAVIVKDQVEEVRRIIEDYGKYFDELCFAVDDKEAIKKLRAEFTDVRFMDYEWINDFADKRNKLAEFVNSEYYMRIDTDDKIGSPECIREVFDRAVKSNLDVVYSMYLYGVDDDGNPVAEHWRETIIKKSDNCYWKKRVHENIFVEDKSKFRGSKDTSFSIIHDVEEGHLETSSERNFKILLEEFNEDGDKTDPRTLAYLGRMLMGNGDWAKAIPFLELLCQRSGWDDDKYFAYIHLSQALSQLERFDESIAACNEAMVMNTDYPDAFLALGEVYLMMEEYGKAKHWLEVGITKPRPDTLFVVDPSIYGYRSMVNLALAYFGLGDFEKAKKLIDKAAVKAPSNEFIKENQNLFEEALIRDKYFNNLVWMAMYLKEHEPKKLQNLLEVIPKDLLKDERVVGFKNSLSTPKTWGDKDIAIFCGRSWEEWAAPSVVKGIGGSEEAVIYISKELSALGYNVTVFNYSGEFEGEYEGVRYKNYWEFNPKDNFNTVIAWRGNIFQNGSIKAKNKIIWMHDVPFADSYPPGSEDTFDKIMVLSEFHKSLLPANIPDEKIFVSANGINQKDFEVGGIDRNSKRIIYTSSYDRGIEHLLNMWSEIREAVPEAELHLFYGWNTYDKMIKEGCRDPEFKKQMVKLMDQPGVFEHGRVGHKQLIKEFKKSGVYAYPSHFEEISCISAMKAQACECIPVVTDYAALKETVKKGVIIDGRAGDPVVNQKFKDSLIEVLKSDELQNKMREESRNNKYDFSWRKVAEQWDKELLNV